MWLQVKLILILILYYRKWPSSAWTDTHWKYECGIAVNIIVKGTTNSYKINDHNSVLAAVG